MDWGMGGVGGVWWGRRFLTFTSSRWINSVLLVIYGCLCMPYGSFTTEMITLQGIRETRAVVINRLSHWEKSVLFKPWSLCLFWPLCIHRLVKGCWPPVRFSSKLSASKKAVLNVPMKAEFIRFFLCVCFPFVVETMNKSDLLMFRNF